MAFRRQAVTLAMVVALAAAGAPALAKPVDRAALDALIAKAEAGDPDGDPKGYLANFEAALAEARRLYPANHPEIAARRQGIAAGLVALSRFDEAKAILDEILPVLEKAQPAYADALADTFSVRGFVANLKGDHATALASFERSVKLYRELAGGKPSRDLAVELSNLAAIRWDAGQQDTSLALNSEAIAMGRKVTPIPPDVAMWYGNRVAYLFTLGRIDEAVSSAQEGVAIAETIVPPGHPALSTLYANLGSILVRQGKPRTALPYLRKAFESIEKASGSPNQNSATMRAAFANALMDAGRYEEAVAFVEAAVPVIEAQLGKEGNRPLQVREIQATALTSLGRHDEALAIEKQVMAIRDRKLPPQHRDRMSGRGILARIAMAKGDYALAEASLKEGLALRAAAVPPSHPEFLAEKSLMLLVQSRARSLPVPQILPQARDAFARLKANARVNPSTPLPASARGAFQYLAEVFALAGDHAAAFEAQQWSVRSTVDSAAAAAALRRAQAGNAGVAGQLDDRRKLVAERAAVMTAVEAQIAAPKPDFDLPGSNAKVAALETRIAAIDTALSTSNIDPQGGVSVSLDQARSRLAKGQIFVQVTPLQDRYLVTALSPRNTSQYIAPGRRTDIDGLVAALRASLDDETGQTPFPADKASALFRALFTPGTSRELRSARELLVSGHGAFGALPFSVLRPGWSGGDYLIDHVAVTRFAGAPRRAAGDSTAMAADLLGLGDVDAAAAPAGAGMARGSRVEGLASLPPLPRASTELADLAAAIGARAPRILVKGDATEKALANARVAPRSVLAFATHGLTSDSFEGLREPALLLAPDSENDGLLTASEIARLDLPASWVILSACNTAAGSGPDAPSLSGLAQAFILAGADTILATHWPVRDDVASAVSAGTLRHAGKGAAPAEALRLSLGDWRKSAKDKAHPALWAAFEVVRP